MSLALLEALGEVPLSETVASMTAAANAERKEMFKVLLARKTAERRAAQVR